MSDRESRVRMRAHELWEQEGRPEGRDTDHWEQASREIDAEDSAPTEKKRASRTRKSAPAAGSGDRLKSARKTRSTT